MTEQDELQQSISKNRNLSPEKLEYQELVHQTVRKLLLNLHQGGFCQEPSKSRRHYSVVLKGKSQGKYGVLLDANFKEGLLLDINLGVGDLDKPLEEKRSLILVMSKLDPTKSFTDPLLEGAFLFSIEESTKNFQNKPLSKEEGIVFLEELLGTTVDEEETKKRFEKARKESPQWPLYWAREGPPLALEAAK